MISDKRQIKLLDNQDIIVFEPSKMLNVPSSTIHIENKMSLIQKKLWFELVYEAFPKMGTQRKYTVSLNKLRSLLGWNETTSNDTELKEALRGLNETTVTWNIFGKDTKNTSWQCFPLLAGCEIPKNSGVCLFSFSPFLEDRFLAMGKEAYVKIDLIISKKFQSKYALSLYCLALDFLMIDIGYSEKIFTIEELRKYLALKEGEYKLTADMNRWIIKPAEKEINNTSDMNIEIKPIKEGKKISGYKLCMSLKEGRAKEYLDKKNRLREVSNIRQLEPIKYIEPEVKKEPERKNLIKITNEKLRSFYAENNISMTTQTVQEKLKDLQEIFQDRFENYLLFLMNYTNLEDSRTKIKSLSGFYIGLIKDDSQMENYFLYHQKQHEQEKQKLSKLDNLLELELKTEYNKYLANDFENYIMQNVDRLENKIIEILKSKLKPGDFFYDVVIQKTCSGIVDKTLITKAKESVRMMTISYLRDYPKELKYKPISFEDWKEEEISETEIEELKENLLKTLK
jgi:plasmid replication initiation protein